MGSTKYQALIVHFRRNHRKMEDHHHNRRQKESRRYPSNIRYYTHDDKGHYSKDCPRNRGSFNKKSNKKRHHAHTTEYNEPTNSYKKKKIPQVMRNMNSTGEDKYHTLIHLNIWIRRNVVSDTQNQYTTSKIR